MWSETTGGWEAGLTRPNSTNLVVIVAMMQVSKRIPFEDPTWLNGLRLVYVLSNIVIVGIYVLVWQKIKAKNGACGRRPSTPARCPC